MRYYELYFDKEFNRDDDYIAYFHSTPSFEEDLASAVWSHPKIRLEGNIYFSADLMVCEQLHFINNSIDIPIISQKIIELIPPEYLNEYYFQKVILFDDTVMSPFDGDILKNEVKTNQTFFIIQVLNSTDAIDYERSHSSKRISVFGEEVTDIKILVFKRSFSSPPIFQIPYFPTNIYITEEFKRTIEANGLLGFRFMEVRS